MIKLNILEDLDIDFAKIKLVFFYVALLGVVTHGYMFFNTNLSHDSLYNINFVDIYDDMLRAGRFVRPLYSALMGNLTTPLLIGVWEIIFLALSTYLLIDILAIKNKISIFFTSCVIITNYSVTLLNATYLSDAGAYSFALFITLLGVKLHDFSKERFILSIACFVIGLGIYQSYIQYAVTVVLMKYMIDLLENKDFINTTIKYIKYIIIIGISLTVYILIHRSVYGLFNVQASTGYNEVSVVGDFTWSVMLECMHIMINSELVWLLNPVSYHPLFVAIINIVFLLIVLAIILNIFINEKYSRIKSYYIIFLMILTSISINFICLLSKGIHHDIMKQSFFLCYVFIIALLERMMLLYNYQWIRRCLLIVYLLLSFWTYDNIVYANNTYLKKELESQSTLSIMTRIVDRIESVPGYEVNKTRVMIVGKLNRSKYLSRNSAFNYNGIGTESNYALSYEGTYDKYLKYFFGNNIKLINKEEEEFIINNIIVKNMPNFPDNGCCKMIDGIVVIKISDTK